jgi:dolichol-phosphate mannosyltransferase
MSMVRDFQNPCIAYIIPAYQPDKKLISIVTELCKANQVIVVVNDGSSQSFDDVFNCFYDTPGVIVLRHSDNFGKGEALKTAFRYVLENYSTVRGVVTLDADGQHLIEDVMNVSDMLAGNCAALWLGSRSFKGNVPFRSKFGNILTKILFRILIGKQLSDTQTGLRGIPYGLLNKIVNLNGKRFSYELNVLIYACKEQIDVREISISVVYHRHNTVSHFRPIVDSFDVYMAFVNYLKSKIG